MTYLLIGLPFLAIAALVAGLATWLRGREILPRILGSVLGLLVLTAIFDNVMIGVGIVGYSSREISGIRVGLAPIEDFGYSIAAGLLLPALSALLTRGARQRREAR